MSAEILKTIFTVGHSNLEFGKFVALLDKHNVQAIADVRSSPYSKYTPQFNREILQLELGKSNISYVFLGLELGARRSESQCYIKGRADYALITQTDAFSQGIARLINGAEKMRIALMCTEKDPIDCHRCILVSPYLRKYNLEVFHIMSDSSLESHKQTEMRLLRLLHLSEQELFKSSDEVLLEAYKIQGEKIAYQEATAEAITPAVL